VRINRDRFHGIIALNLSIVTQCCQFSIDCSSLVDILIEFSFSAALPTFCVQALGLLWNHYVNVLATKSGVVDHILAVYHTQLVTMPWNGFYPDMHAIELMVKVSEASARFFLTDLWYRIFGIVRLHCSRLEVLCV
jgi:hypothetical protein